MALYKSPQRSGVTGRKSYLPSPKYALGLTRPPTQPIAPVLEEPMYQPPKSPYQTDTGGGRRIGREDIPAGVEGGPPGPFSPGEAMAAVATVGGAVPGIALKKGIEYAAPWVKERLINPAMARLGFSFGSNLEDERAKGYEGSGAGMGMMGTDSTNSKADVSGMGMGMGIGMGRGMTGVDMMGTGLGMGMAGDPGAVGNKGSNAGRDMGMSSGSKDASDPDGGFW